MNTKQLTRMLKTTQQMRFSKYVVVRSDPETMTSEIGEYLDEFEAFEKLASLNLHSEKRGIPARFFIKIEDQQPQSTYSQKRSYFKTPKKIPLSKFIKFSVVRYDLDTTVATFPEYVDEFESFEKSSFMIIHMEKISVGAKFYLKREFKQLLFKDCSLFH
eukprot:gene6176-10183_t